MLYCKKIILAFLIVVVPGLLASEGKFSKGNFVAQQRAQQGKHEKTRLSPEKESKKRLKAALRKRMKSKTEWLSKDNGWVLLRVLFICISLYGVAHFMSADSATDLIMPAYIADFRHPGKIAAPTKIASQKEVQVYLQKLYKEFYSEKENLRISVESQKKSS